MASKKEKIVALNKWADHFSGYSLWGDQFLIRRSGPVVAGICLDATRDPKSYKPVFFFHNLLIASRVVTLSYGQALHYRAGHRLVKYEQSPDDAIGDFISQFGHLVDENDYGLFLAHVRSSLKGMPGFLGAYLPHALRDAITVGSYLGDRDFFISRIDSACDLIGSRGGINLNIIGSVDLWRDRLINLLNSNLQSLIEQNASDLGVIRSLPMAEMKYKRPEGFPGCLLEGSS